MAPIQIVVGLLACALAACATTRDHRDGGAQARLLALAEVENDYSYCASTDRGSIGGFHPYMPDCIEDLVARSSQSAWCDYPQAIRLSAAQLEAAEAPSCAGDAEVAPPQARSIIARVIEYQQVPAHPDALDYNETLLLRTSPLMWLRERCLADSYGGISRATGAPVRDLSLGEALLCAALSQRWESTRRAMYWPEN